MIFFIPARGRKHRVRIQCTDSADDFLYPREGTETLLPSYHPLRRYGRIFFIPARGRKQPATHQLVHRHHDFLYPREGTETRRVAAHIVAFYRFSLSPRGDGNGKFLKTVSACARFSLSPRGDGNRKTSLYVFAGCDFLYPRKGPPFPTKIDIFAIHLFTNSA